MRSRLFVVAILLMSIIGSSIVPIMAQISPPTQNELVELTQQLRNEVESADNELFQGFTVTRTDQAKTALNMKIDVVIMMFEHGDFQAGYGKLDNDLAAKLNICDTERVRALSWLSLDPALSVQVHEFAGVCQSLIEDIRFADPR